MNSEGDFFPQSQANCDCESSRESPPRFFPERNSFLLSESVLGFALRNARPAGCFDYAISPSSTAARDGATRTATGNEPRSAFLSTMYRSQFL